MTPRKHAFCQQQLVAHLMGGANFRFRNQGAATREKLEKTTLLGMVAPPFRPRGDRGGG